MNDILKIVNLNAYIQHTGKLFLNGKEILWVSLDRTCTFEGDSEENNITLTDTQLEDLWYQATHLPEKNVIPRDNDNSRHDNL